MGVDKWECICKVNRRARVFLARKIAGTQAQEDEPVWGPGN